MYVFLNCKQQIQLFQYKYQSKLDETLETMLGDMGTCLQEKLLSVLEYTLNRLARYDEGNPIGALLSMAPKPNSIFNKMRNFVGDQGLVQNLTGSNPNAASPTSANTTGQKNVANQPQNSGHLGHSYVNFMRGSSELLRQIVIDEVWVNNLFERWYSGQMRMINEWLTERLQQSLSAYQLTCLSFIVKVSFESFSISLIFKILESSF